jgi:hypothetical protein
MAPLAAKLVGGRFAPTGELQHSGDIEQDGVLFRSAGPNKMKSSFPVGISLIVSRALHLYDC